LTKLDAKRKPEDVLRSIVDPSKEIEDKYRTSQFLLDTGKSVIGLVVEESSRDLTLMDDPLASCEPVLVEKEAIDERYKSKLSLMPSGLLDQFTEEEILELCAFVVARGDENAAVYQQ
jgi:putative heme-binding domain-containing protein